MKHCINLELISVDLHCTYIWMFHVNTNLNVLNIKCCTVATKNIRNIHTVSTNQIVDILPNNDNWYCRNIYMYKI